MKEENEEEPATIKCQSCGSDNGQEDHTCPYKEDINGDSETLCNCCSECRYGCLRDI